MPCNGNNHSPYCNCGWGGFNYGSTRSGTVSKNSTITPYRCKTCNSIAYEYKNYCGGLVNFSRIGHPWIEHDCKNTSNIEKEAIKFVSFLGIDNPHDDKNVVRLKRTSINQDIYLIIPENVKNSINCFYLSESVNGLHAHLIFSIGEYYLTIKTKAIANEKDFHIYYNQYAKNLISDGDFSCSKEDLVYLHSSTKGKPIKKEQFFFDKHAAAKYYMRKIKCVMGGRCSTQEFGGLYNFIYLLRAISGVTDSCFDKYWQDIDSAKISSQYKIKSSLIKCLTHMRLNDNPKLSTPKSIYRFNHEACFTVLAILSSDFNRMEEIIRQTHP